MASDLLIDGEARRLSITLLCGVQMPPSGRGGRPRRSTPHIRRRHITHQMWRATVVQGALKLILEPVFEADFQPGSFGYRPKRTAHDAIERVAEAIVQRKTRVLDFDLRAYFDNVRHDRLLEKAVARFV